MKFLLTFLFSFIILTTQAQQFSQINTGTLFDSFENPAQRAFIPDSSRQFASSFFIPNFGANGSLSGKGQNSIHSLINTGYYNSTGLISGLQNRTNLNVGFNSYWLMLKMYSRLNGDQEFGISAQTKAEGYGSITDETLLLLDSYKNLANGTANTDLFNNQLKGQAYHQLSLIFRKKVSPSVAFGLKLSTLLGIYYNKLNIEHSAFSVTPNLREASLTLQGTYISSYSGKYAKKNVLGLKNPGAAVGFGLQAQLDNGLLLQGNIKNLGFIRWSSDAVTYNFSGTQNINRISTVRKNDSRILTEADSIINLGGSNHAIYEPIDGTADFSVSKKFNLFTADLYYTPTLTAVKNLFYNGLTAAFVNHVNYKSLWLTALASCNQDKVWNGGLQLMIKSPNAEFYIGTEQLLKSGKFFNRKYVNYNASGINAFLGFSAKFGRMIEHPANASYIPTGEERGFFMRMWKGIFKTHYN